MAKSFYTAARVPTVRGGGEVGWAKPACDRWGGVRPAGPVVLMGHRARVRLGRAGCFRVVLGRHYGLRLKLSPAQRRARASPGPKKSCWAHARVGPKNRALGRPMGLVLNGHLYRRPGPRQLCLPLQAL
jgi:hypothetical protein